MNPVSSLIIPKTAAEELSDRTDAIIASGRYPRPFLNRIVVAKYVRKTVGKTGRIIAASQTQREDGWQGKIGLVIEAGPLAFLDDANNDFKGQSVKKGDWVIFRYSDGNDFEINDGGTENLPAKMILDKDIAGIIPDPDCVY